MKLGISFLPDSGESVQSPASYYKTALDLCKIADGSGLSSVKMTEHYLHAYGGYCPSPIAFLSAVSTCTKHVRLITGCILASFHHPIQIAAEAAMLDAISGGRAEIGFARAYMPYEFHAFGVSMDGSRERFSQCIGAVVKLWSEERVTLRSEFFDFSDVHSLPRPTQVPYPPIWCAAVKSKQSFAWIGEEGFGLLVSSGLDPMEQLRDNIETYRRSFVAKPGSRGARVALSLPVFVDKEDRDARRKGEIYLKRYFQVWADAASALETERTSDYPGYAGIARSLRSTPIDKLIDQSNVLFGSPEHVAARLVEMGQELGIDEVLLQIDFGAMSHLDAVANLKVIVDGVLPRVS
jgi:alkanesulfonate monooxygenase SsuD/methylene tetrahydromethanopterin reductase-like flavin-dependent oxidoreductase (luciferase family)